MWLKAFIINIFFSFFIFKRILQLQRRHEQTLRSLEAQKLEMEEKRKAFESERAAWEQASGHTLEELRRRSLEANSRE